MKTLVIPCLVALFLTPVVSAQLAAGNIRPVQRADSKLVDIDYDVTGTSEPVTVSLQGSADGGVTWTLPVNSLTGAVGNNVTPGSNLRITWDAGADWNQQVSTQTKFRITVSDEPPPPAPVGFSLIPAGAFTMGDALDGLSDAPTHTVNVSAFYMEQNLVTKAQWDTVRTYAISNGYSDLASGAGKASNHPVQTVSWYQMVKYCNARSQQEGLTPAYYTNDAQTTIYKTGDVNVTNAQVNWAANGYRLPTEAEWEKAARGGLSGKRFPWGDTITHSQANYYASSSYSYDLSGAVNNYHPTYGTGSTPYTSPVGSFAANGYGLNDMAGNVWQWCWDWYGTYATGTPTDPRGVSSGADRVLRGGRWYGSANDCRVANRFILYPAYSSSSVGFRVARSSVPDVVADFSLIPAGVFIMGDALDGLSDAPTHTVNVSAFYMARNLVTKAQWDTVRTYAISNGYSDLAAGAGKASNHPVQTVSWWDGVKYCNARSQQEGLTPVYTVGGAVMKTGTTAPVVNWAANGYRLPTEAEWEKAARGGLSGKRFPWGDTITHSQANYYASSSYSYDLSGAVNNYHPTYGTGSTPYTSPVGSFAANGYGLNDMAGNVWQWCWDWYGTYATGTPTDPRGVSSGSLRVFRGGSWAAYAYYCRVANRYYDNGPASADFGIGFRVARSSVP